jgi:hypothetical protein
LIELLKKYLTDDDNCNNEKSKLVLSDHVQEVLLSAFADAYVSSRIVWEF